MLLLTRRAMVFGGCAFISGCAGEEPAPPPPPPPPAPPPSPIRLNFSFASGLDGWEPAYADYTLGMEPSIGFAFGHEPLPNPLAGAGLFLSSNNRSDDVFMYVTRLLDGLAPGTRYRVDFIVTLATNAPPFCPGAGGSPGESVYVKAGATSVRPERVTQGSFVTVNFDKGDQMDSSASAIVIGNLAQDVPDGACPEGNYQRKTLSTGTQGRLVSSDSQGRLWLIIGTDSGFEGFTKVYYLSGSATLTPA